MTSFSDLCSAYMAKTIWKLQNAINSRQTFKKGWHFQCVIILWVPTLCIFRIFTSDHQRSDQSRDLSIISQWGKIDTLGTENHASTISHFKPHCIAFANSWFPEVLPSYPPLIGQYRCQTWYQDVDEEDRKCYFIGKITPCVERIYNNVHAAVACVKDWDVTRNDVS